MTIECLGAIQWDISHIVASVAGAAMAGVVQVVIAIVRRKKPSDDASPGGSTEITVAPQTRIENKPHTIINPTYGLDAKAVGQVLDNAVDPLRQDIAASRAETAALSDQLAAGQLAPRQPVPDSEGPLKTKAVEFFNTGVDVSDKGAIAQAFGHWLDAVSLDPEHANAHYNLGVALATRNELDGAVKCWNRTLRIEPNHLNARYNLGKAAQDKDDLDEAIGHYNAVLQIDPNDGYTHNNLGLILRARGELNEAIEHFRVATRNKPKTARHHDNLARATAQNKDPAEAVAALAKAIELDERYRDKAKTDTDFDPIRDDPAFRKLVYGE